MLKWKKLKIQNNNRSKNSLRSNNQERYHLKNLWRKSVNLKDRKKLQRQRYRKALNQRKVKKRLLLHPLSNHKLRKPQLSLEVDHHFQHQKQNVMQIHLMKITKSLKSNRKILMPQKESAVVRQSKEHQMKKKSINHQREVAELEQLVILEMKVVITNKERVLLPLKPNPSTILLYKRSQLN